MKTTLFTIFIILSALIMVGCESDTTTILIVDEIPQPPQGVTSVTGDGEVTVSWYGPYIEDLVGFVVYRSLDPVVDYQSIGVVDAVLNPNLDLIPYEFVDINALNGVTYYYAVTSVDDAGQESEQLSAETVGDTPRPEGLVTLYDKDFDSTRAGLILDTTLWIVAYNDPDADIYIDIFLGEFNLNAKDTSVYIQDMGYALDFDSLSIAPNTFEGWSQYGFSEIIIGHIYVIWDADGFFTKLRVIEIDFDMHRVEFEWAFQLDPNNPQLVQPQIDLPKPDLVKNYNTKRIASNNQ